MVHAQGVFHFVDVHGVEGDVGERFRLGALQYYSGGACLAAAQVVHVDVADGGEVVVVHSLAGIHARDVEEVLHFVKLAVPYVQVLHESAAVGVALHVDAALAVACVGAVLHEHVSHSARQFAADNHGMQSLEAAAAYHDVLRWRCAVPTVVVPSALDGHVVVAVVELNVLDEYVA